jgi:hypothetical protein
MRFRHRKKKLPMMRFGLLLCLLAALMPALTAQQDVPPDTQAGNFLFKMPTGWNPVEKGDTTFLFAPASFFGTNTFIAMAANDLDGDLRNSFNQLWAGFTKSYRVLEGGQIAPLHARKGYDAFYTGAVAIDQNGKRWTVYVMGAGYGKRIQTVMFMSDLPPGSALNACQEVFRTFLFNLSFGDALPGSNVPAASDAAAIPEKPHKLPPGALEGIYVGFSVGGGGRVGLRRLHFNADGWVVKDVPQEGMIGFDFTAYRNDRNTNRSWVGRYRVAGNQINIVWQDYTENREVITRNEASAHPALQAYIPMCRCTGKRFSGKYLWGLKTSGQYLQFFPDGTFIDHGVTDQMLVPSPYYDHPRIQRGTYSIQSQTMIFTFADGRRGMRTFIAPKAQENAQVFDWIGLGWQTLYEEHYQDQP